jgi:hypothetical protein
VHYQYAQGQRKHLTNAGSNTINAEEFSSCNHEKQTDDLFSHHLYCFIYIVAHYITASSDFSPNFFHTSKKMGQNPIADPQSEKWGVS